MLNNKGFAVSTILYTILIAFLLFLGVTLAMFSTSINIIGNANNDLINNTAFKVVQVKDANPGCGSSYQWYQKVDKTNSDVIIKINSKYGSGTMYWPKDFPNARVIDENNNINPVAGDQNGNIKVEFDNSSRNIDNGIYGELTFTDTKGTTEDEDDEIITIFLADVCK